MTVEVECRVRHCGGDFRAPLELTAGQDTASINTYSPSRPAGHARTRYSPSCPLVLTAFTFTYSAYRDPSLALRMTCVRREGFIFYAAHRPVISSGAACRDGERGIGTIETLTREISCFIAACTI